MDKSLIYSKTAKGMSEFMSGGKSLPREQARILSLINGKSSIGDLEASGALLEGKYAPAIEGLLALGLIRIFEHAKYRDNTVEWTAGAGGDGQDESDILPSIVVEELSPQESVQIWAQAKRGASELKSAGFYSYGNKGALALLGGEVGMRALVVEDDEELAELLVVLLSEKGMLVEVAPDVPAALAAIHEGAAPDVVLLDIVLPGQAGKDGFDVLAYIRRQPSWAKVPVIMVTSEVSDDQVMKGLKAGADGYIFKPFKWEALYACIKETVGI
ncbi:response regulator transcription factor [Massilia sp. CF038]|uniref:response regulator n=1 Tax=Massilia sp. CF038 TaxID=1881045 RepID=UPI000919ECBD|nr:response regulator transcription factor [Massilia sp. CF038]SHH53971.1 Response regulator receiver domain-containing protein [Massilia sp. CF038]